MNNEEHMWKETAKSIIDNNPNYPEYVKNDIKNIIDAGQSPMQIIESVLVYLSQYTNFG